MKSITKSFLLALPLVVSSQILANDNFTFGIGAGSFYSGIGVNAGIKSKTDIKYISAGCVSYSSLNGEACGAGIGWVTTDLLSSTNNKHGTSVYLGIVGSENTYYNNDPIYGLGLGYHYFFRGINNSGFNLGFTFVTGKDNDDLDIDGMFQVGYQF